MGKQETKNTSETIISLPKVGDEIYVYTSRYLGHGRDDVMGGLAKVTSVKSGFVTVAEHPGVSYNWECLVFQQDDLKERFGKNRAHPSSDSRSMFNED